MSFIACEEDDVDVSEFTGNEMVYNLTPESTYYNGSGSVTIKERVDQGVTIEIAMDPTGSGGSHPAHLHYGTFDVPDAEMAAMLIPVDASTGLSVTTIYMFLDETEISYNQLIDFDGSIKVHLDDGPNKKVVIAATNIGINASMNISDIAVCSSEKQAI
ncbi:MAG: hypothetical protein DHS20C17_11620 [Cyclobacteriaceae bacterium]|nr:MAG: hypothetical protein DHS20C17_11620 [Cyclobacteriaceae bacterium]